MRDPLFELMVAITCTCMPSYCVSAIILELIGVHEQPLYGQVIIGMWGISTITAFVMIQWDDKRRYGVCG